MLETKFKPVIKWSGSKRSQAPTIIQNIPNFEKYYEPFVGGGSITYALAPKVGTCGDAYSPLIEFWQKIKNEPDSLADNYNKQWQSLQTIGHTYFYEVRDRFNLSPNAEDLLFLSRTCVNGLIRFNRNGEFNNALHHTRKGINPKTLHSIILEWSNRVQGIEFICGDYRETLENVTPNDFVYLDPPYFNTKHKRYFGTIEYEPFLKFLEALNSKGVKYALSYDGVRGENDYTVALPKELYKQHLFIDSGNSSFRKVMDGKQEMVAESLYLNY